MQKTITAESDNSGLLGFPAVRRSVDYGGCLSPDGLSTGSLLRLRLLPDSNLSRTATNMFLFRCSCSYTFNPQNR